MEIKVYGGRRISDTGVGICSVGSENGIIAMVKQYVNHRRTCCVGKCEESSVTAVYTCAEFKVKNSVVYLEELSHKISFVFGRIIYKAIACSADLAWGVHNLNEIPVSGNTLKVGMTELFVVHEEFSFA